MSYQAVDPELLRALAHRAWDRLAEHKASYWPRRRAEAGPAAAFLAAAHLRAQMRGLDPTWPAAEQRADDLASHARVAALLRRAATRST